MSAPFTFTPGATDAGASSSSSHPHGAAASHHNKKDAESHRESIKTPVGGGGIQTLKRAQVFAELSRTKRNETFNKRRRGHEAATDGSKEGAAATPTTPVALSEVEVQQLLTSFRAAYVLSSNPLVATATPSPSVPASERARLLRQLRLLLSNDDAPVGVVVASGVIPCLVAELGAQVSAPAAAAAASSSSAAAPGDSQSTQLDAIL
jgi:hypothetical protein